MTRVRILALTLSLAWLNLSLNPTAVQAQATGPRPPPGGAPQIDCAAIAANPNAGMDQASCEAMLRAQQSYQAAQTDPAASRPGDASMTCEDIKAEFMRQPITRPDPQHVAAAQAATSDYMARSAQIQAEATAMAAASSAENLAAGAASAVNPVAGRAAEAAAAAHQAAAQAKLNAEARTQLTPRYRALMSGNAALVTDASAELDANPRIGRLVQLANDKHCHGW